MSSSVQLTRVDNPTLDKFVRFEDRDSEGSASSEQPLFPATGLSLSPSPSPYASSENNATHVSAFDVIRRGFQRSSRGIRSFRGSLSFNSFYHQSRKKASYQNKILDPQGPFLHRWNKIFLISCIFAMAWDPLFLYVPVIDGNKNCLKLDHKLEIIACVLRTITDLFYLLHIYLQFRTGFISPSSRVLGRGELITDPAAITRRYLSSYFIVDLLAVLPFPQMAVSVIIPNMSGGHLSSKGLLKLVIFTQYAPRLFRIYPLYKGVTRTSGIITETAWAGAALNLFLYMLASHLLGAVWYLFAIDRLGRCWHDSCKGQGCPRLSFYCEEPYRPQGNYTVNLNYCKVVQPDEIKNAEFFNFGMVYDALNSQVVQSSDFLQKLFYCFWWGLRNLSSLGQNLQTSTFIGENLFAALICVSGLVLFSLLIGNMQKYVTAYYSMSDTSVTTMSTSPRGLEEYLQSTTIRIEEMRVRRRDAERWMSHRLLPDDLRGRIRRYEQYKWQETRGVDEELVIRNLPKDLRRDIKRHLCLALIKKVPMLWKMDERLKDAVCDRLKPVLYTEKSYIVREGDPVNEMLFIMRGHLSTMTTNGGRTGFFNSLYLDPGDFCGEELLTWALDPHSSANLPISTRTVQSLTDVEAFALAPDDLKFVASQFRRLHSKQLRHTFRSSSHQWRLWAAGFIQAAWRRYARRKLEKSLEEAEEDGLLSRVGGSSPPSLGATIYVSRFAANALRNLRRKSPQNLRVPPQSPPHLNLPKPAEPDFTSEDG